MSINNIHLVKELLNFSNDGDFYQLYIMKRKKDQPEGEKDNHQSVRTIKTYCIESLEYLDKRYDEIMSLCEFFSARAYIHVQKQNHSDVSLEMMIQLAQRLKVGQFRQQSLFDSVVGQIQTLEKRWVVDIDSKDDNLVKEISEFITVCRPEGNKILQKLPTKNGYHLITERFDVLNFKSKYPEIDIQKKNPCLLYLPSSLMD